MDSKFIQRATQITSFNFMTSDFTSLTYKKEIQSLFTTHFFPSFNLNSTLSSVDKAKLNTLISNLKEISSKKFESMHFYNLKGVGPGEVTMYYLLDNAKLGGGTSAGVDLIVGSSGYEIKAVKVSRDGHATDFKLGGTVPLADIVTDLYSLSSKLGTGGSKTEISGSIIDRIKTARPKEYELIEDKFRDVAYNNYFKNHEIIFINNAKGSSLGKIEAIKKVTKSEITIERVTSGTVKPKVKL